VVLGGAERYVVEQQPNGVVIRMRQGLRGLFFLFFSAAVLAATWWFGPYGPRPAAVTGAFYWIWSGGWAFMASMGLLGAFYTEDWTITHDEIAVRRGFRSNGRVRRVAKASSLGLMVERMPPQRGRTPIFPWRVHVLDAAGARTRLKMDLQRRESVDELLRALRLGMTVQIQEPADAGRPAPSV
jgi:hypothetical protein